MSVSDFLFNGSAPPSVSSYGGSVANVPTWLSDFTQGLVAKANAVGAEEYQHYGGPRVASQTADTKAAYDKVRGNVGAYTPTLNGAIGMASGAPGASQPFVNAGTGALNQGMSMTQGAVAPGKGGLNAAQPWLNSASGSFTGDNVNQYMNPYTDNVINHATDMANRNFQEKIMPGLNDQFTANGQYGSTGHMMEANRAARDMTEGLQSGAMGALGQAYDSGRSAFGADTSRYAGLAGTAGNLGTAQQTAELNAGQNMGALGQAFGTMGNQQGQLGIDAATQMGSLARTGQQMGVTDAAQLGAIGSEQQNQNQRNLDTAYGDFQNETNYPRSTIDWMSNLIRGQNMPTTTATLDTNTNPAGTNVSGLSQLTGLASGLNGLNSANTVGMPVSRAARGGRVRYFRRGGLTYAVRAA